MNAATENMVGKFLEPVFQALPPEAARRIVDLEADEESQRRVELLESKANEGELTAEEQEEYEMYAAAGDLLATLQALARRTLGRAQSS